jgi:hypothetical protein
MSVSNTLVWLRQSAELSEGIEARNFFRALECLLDMRGTMDGDKKYIVRIERELREAQTRIEMARNTLIAPAGRAPSAGTLYERAMACHEILSADSNRNG